MAGCALPFRHRYARRATISSSFVLSAITVTRELVGRNHTVACPRVPRGIQCDPEELEAAAALFAQPRRILADPAGERQRLDSAHRGRVGADRFLHLVHENVQRQIGARRARGFQIAHVAARHSRKSGQPSAHRQLAAYFFRAPAVAFHHVEHGENVQVAVPRGVFQSRLGRESHRGIHTPSAIDRAHRRTAAQVAAHQLDLPPQHGRHALRDIAVRRAVEAVLFHAVLLPDRRHPVLPRVFRHGGVKLGFEGRYNRHPGHRLLEGLDGRQIDRVVRRRGRQELPQGRRHIAVHHECAAIFRAGVHRLQCHRVNRRGARRNLRDRVAVVGDTLQPPFGEHRLRRHFEDLKLERCGSEVRYEKVHLIPVYCVFMRARLVLAICWKGLLMAAQARK